MPYVFTLEQIFIFYHIITARDENAGGLNYLNGRRDFINPPLLFTPILILLKCTRMLILLIRIKEIL